MVCRATEKTAGLLIAIVIIAASLIYVPDWNIIGASRGCGILCRISYSFFHASPIHAALNAWCFLSILFLYDIAWPRILLSYLIAVLAPDCVLSLTPTVGLSAVCFALLGSIAFQVAGKIHYNICMAAYIAIGFLFPHVNAPLHLYSYIAGIILSILIMPIKCRKYPKLSD